MELTSALQSEQHIKKEIARKIGQLQEDLHGAKEQVCVCREIKLVLKQVFNGLIHTKRFRLLKPLAELSHSFHVCGPKLAEFHQNKSSRILNLTISGLNV